MKISVIITTILVAQVSASFFDVFHGAVLSVQNSFGKLLSDVVTDVKETVDCTILAVEHVLSLSHDATTRYYDKCSSGTNKTDSVSEAPQDAIVPKVEVTLNLPNNNEEYLQKVIPAEIDARINERLSKVLGNYKTNDNVLSIENVLAKESEQLAGVSVLVKKELEKLSNAVTTDLKNIEKQRDSQPSVDTILQEIKILEQRERNTKNASEAHEIHRVIDRILGKLDAIEATEATENVKLEEILKDLENNSNNSFAGLRRQFEEWKEEEARHLSEIKSKIEEHEKISDHHHESYKRHGSHLIQPRLFDTDMNRDDVDPFSISPETSSDNLTLVLKVLDNSTSFRTLANSNDKSTIPAAYKTSSPQNKTEDSTLNDTVITSNSYSTTKSPIESEVIHPIETPTVVGWIEISTSSTNQSTTTPNNLFGDNTKLTIATLSITENTFINESIQSIYSITDSSKQQTLPTNETAPILSTDTNNSTQSVIPIQTPEITAVEDATLAVKSNTVSKKVESPDSDTKNNTVTAETALTEITSTSLNNNNVNAANSSTAKPLVENTFVNARGSENEASSIWSPYELATTLAIFEEIQSPDTMITSTSPSINVGTSVNEKIIPIETSTTNGKIESLTVTTTIVNADFNDTKITSTSLSTVANPLETIHPIETTTASSKKESTTTIVHDNNSKDIIMTSTSLPIVENTPVRDSIQIKGSSSTSSDNTTTSNDSSPVVENATVSLTIEPEGTTAASGLEEFLNGSNGSIIASNYLPIVENIPVNYIIEETTTVSSNEESTEAVTELTTTLKMEKDIYTTTSILSPNISITESETIQAIDTTKVCSSEVETSDSTAIETPIIVNDEDDSSATIVTSTADTISERTPAENVAKSDNYETITSTTNSPIASPATSVHTDSITSTTFPVREITTVSEIIELESNTLTGNILPNALATIPEQITNENIETKYNVTSYTENTDSTVVTETIATTTASEVQDLSSTSTQSAINEIITTSTAFPATESISESKMVSKNEVKLRNSLTFIPDQNVIKGPPLIITESPPVSREWLAPNIMPVYGQPAMPPITRGVFNDAQKQADAFAIFDSIDKRLSHLDPPFGPENNIPIANIPSTPLLANVAWKPLEPSFLPPLHPIRPLSFDDSVPGNAYRPQGLTTHRPRNANNYKNPSIDYDSFFHTPPRNSEAHQRAVKEARQIIANSKRSDRIINNIMKNKNKFNPRSIFNG